MQPVDFSSPEFLADPYPLYRDLLAAGAAAWLPAPADSGMPGIWLLSAYADAAGILRMAGPYSMTAPERRTVPLPLDRIILNLDGADHARLRKLVAPAFSQERIRAIEADITAVADTLIDGIIEKDRFDFAREIALPLPVAVIGNLLGIPPDDRDTLLRITMAVTPGFDTVHADSGVLRTQQLALGKAIEYFGNLIEQKRRRPGRGLIDDLVRAHDSAGSLDMAELLDMCLFIWFAGHETTIGLLGNGMLAMLRHPAALDRLQKQPELMASAVEEMLRFDSPVQRSTYRIVTDDCEIGGRRLRRGERISAVIAAANRDPRHFQDPDTFDITRAPNPHLAFGQGMHGCLGAGLARAEARIGFGRLLTRLPGIRLGGEPVRNRNTFFRSLASLPVQIT